MRFSLRRAIAVAAAALSVPFASAADEPGQSSFVTPDGSLGFAITVANDKSSYMVSLRMSTSRSWGAFGLGSDDMFGALMFIIYQGETSGSVTFSPRVSYHNYEPEYYGELPYKVFDNLTTVADGFMSVTAQINDLRWPQMESPNGGWFDYSRPDEPAIYALGPKQTLYSDAKDANLRFHEEFGVVAVNLKRTHTFEDIPALNKDTKSDGITLRYNKSNQVDTRSTLHATFMVLAVLVLLPLGVVFLRVTKWTRWHGFTQLIALIIILAAVGLGIADSFYYRRSWHFNSAHQIIGLITLGLLITQLTLGVFHHMEFQKTQGPTFWSPIHLWLGRGVMLLAWINCFLGFRYAMNERTGMIIAGVIILILFGCLLYTFWLQRAAKKRRDAALFGSAQAAEYSDINQQGDREGHQQGIDLQTVSPWKSGKGNAGRTYVDEPELGAVATPKAAQ